MFTKKEWVLLVLAVGSLAGTAWMCRYSLTEIHVPEVAAAYRLDRWTGRIELIDGFQLAPIHEQGEAPIPAGFELVPKDK